MLKTAAVIPVYEHERAIGAMVEGVLAAGLHCILVDDGSGAECARVLAQLAAAHPTQVSLVTHAINRGKGSAVLTGCARAKELGYDHLLQIDADGQHRVAEIPIFLALSAAHPAAVIIGTPVYDESVSKTRFYFRYLTHLLVWLNTLSFEIRDSMCGFRVYPLAPVLSLAGYARLGQRMDFDIDILVRLSWAGVKIVNHPTPVRYPADGVSHFDLWRDNALITRLHALLFLGMLARLPRLLARRVRAA